VTRLHLKDGGPQSLLYPAPYDKESKRHRYITNAAAYCVAKDMLPISTVENKGFKWMLKVIDPIYIDIDIVI